MTDLRFPTPSRSTGIRRLATLALPILIVFLVPRAAEMWTDWLWFREVGFDVVFTKRLVTKIGLFTVTGLAVFAFLALNLGIARRSGVSGRGLLIRMSPELPPVDIGDALAKLAYPVAAVISIVFALAASSRWITVLEFLHRTSFGLEDPLFGRDISAYVFELPMISFLLSAFRALVVMTLLAVVAIYVLRGLVTLPPKPLAFERPADRHVALLLVAFLVLTALQVWLVRLPNLLYSTTGPLVGASYTDLHARYPGLHAIAITALIGVALVAYGFMRRKIVWFTLLAAGSYVAVSFVAGALIPMFVQRFLVTPTELTREAPQLKTHIAATRKAWALDRVETRDLSGDASLSLADINANATTIQNVRLWDRAPLLQTFGQLQEIRTYYDFVNVDDDRYVIDGRYRQVLLSARELNTQSLPTRSFINQHLTFTHGMGLTLSPVNEVASEGLPVLFIKDLPPASSVSLKVTRPQIYYGELTDDHVFVKTKAREFDYPSGEANIFTSYTGTGGVSVGSFFRRAALALRFGALNILLSGDITGDSRVLFHRKVRDRAQLALPFVEFDADPYLVIADNGELRWILDGYTSTDRYPYSHRLRGGVSYMRNSVKVVVDAYNGSIEAYISEPDDPLVQTYAKVFPGTLKPISAMPADMRKHIRFPRELFRIQAALYATYHMDQPETFYHREDQWQIPSTENDPESSDRFMRHLVMRLPEEKEAEYIYMAPFSPRGKDNLAAWMVARNDGANYGKIRVYRFPKQSLVYGPKQIMSRINQDTDISRELTLWDQRGSEVIRGELLVIPIEEALLYVQPIYLRAEGGRIPELKRVVIAFQNRVLMAETLEAGLARMFGDGGGRLQVPATVPTPAGDSTQKIAGGTTAKAPEPTALAREAQQIYERALGAQRSGDWAAYGAEIRRLGETLRRLNGTTQR